MTSTGAIQSTDHRPGAAVSIIQILQSTEAVWVNWASAEDSIYQTIQFASSQTYRSLR